MKVRIGLRLHANKVPIEIGIAFKKFAKWLRRNYEFPIRVPVYLSSKEKVTGRDGEDYVSIFFAPFDNKVEPYITIGTGDYSELVKKEGADNAMCSLLFSLALSVIKYKKWIDDNSGLDSFDPDSEATNLLCEYIEEVKKP